MTLSVHLFVLLPLAPGEVVVYPSRMSPRPGDPAPEFETRSDGGDPLSLVDVRGHWLVLFFFPRANTTHCQLQARRFEALAPAFGALNARILGVSSDARAQQMAFRNLCQLSFPLIPDTDHQLSERYGVLGEPFPGEETRLARRETFLISPEGRVVRHWTEVIPKTHAAEGLEELRKVLGQPAA